MKPASLLRTFACSTALLSAQTPDASRMKADVNLLASLAFEGRMTGTAGQMKAAKLVAARFRDLGLLPLGTGPDPYFLPYDLEHRTAQEEGSFLSLKDHRVPLGSGASTFRLSPLTTTLTFLSEGATLAPGNRGGWVAQFVPSGFQAKDGDALMYAALSQGATGVLFLPRPGEDALGPLRNQGVAFILRGRYGFPADGPPPAGPPEAMVDEASAKALGLDLPALLRSTSPINLGSFQIQLHTHLDTLRPVNVAGLLEGSDPKRKDEIIILSAHEDHLGVVNGQMYPGADDNASGTAVLMEAARLLKDTHPRRSILFLSVSGEEEGLFGSRAFMAQPPIPLRRIMADLNTDMVGRNDVRTLSVTPAAIEGATGTLTRDARAIAMDLGLTLTDEADDYWKRSDHYTFAKAGIPSIFFFGGMEPDYHQPSDTPDKVEGEKLAHVTELLTRLALRVANADTPPRSLPRRAWESWSWPSRLQAPVK